VALPPRLLHQTECQGDFVAVEILRRESEEQLLLRIAQQPAEVVAVCHERDEGFRVHRAARLCDRCFRFLEVSLPAERDRSALDERNVPGLESEREIEDLPGFGVPAHWRQDAIERLEDAYGARIETPGFVKVLEARVEASELDLVESDHGQEFDVSRSQ